MTIEQKLAQMSREERLAELVKVEKPSRWEYVKNTPDARMFLAPFGDKLKGFFLWPGERSRFSDISFTKEEFMKAQRTQEEAS